VYWERKGRKDEIKEDFSVSRKLLTFHANEQQVRSQLTPATFPLLLVNPVPVKAKEVHHNLPSNCVIQSLLQV